MGWNGAATTKTLWLAENITPLLLKLCRLTGSILPLLCGRDGGTRMDAVQVLHRPEQGMTCTACTDVVGVILR